MENNFENEARIREGADNEGGIVPSDFPVSPAPDESVTEEALKAKYGKIYKVKLTLEPDDESTVEKEYIFKKPSTASYDRYIKTVNNSATKANKAFILDNIVVEHGKRFEQDCEEYPALPLSIVDKLMSILGIAKASNLKQL